MRLAEGVQNRVILISSSETGSWSPTAHGRCPPPPQTRRGDLLLNRDGRSGKLLFRREWPYFYACDVLSREGEDLRALPLVERNRRRGDILPRAEFSAGRA